MTSKLISPGRGYRGIHVAFWYRAFLLLRAMVLTPLVLFDLSAVRGHRSARFEKAAILWLVSINGSSSGRLQFLISRLAGNHRGPELRSRLEYFDRAVLTPSDLERPSGLDLRLEAHGFQWLGQVVDEITCRDLLRRASGSEVKDDRGERFPHLDDWLKSASATDRAFLNIDAIEFFQNYIQRNRSLHDLISSYLNADPLVVRIQAWATRRPIDEHEVGNDQSGMMFHCDADYLRFVKLFVALSDPAESGGETEFQLSSHRGKRHVLGRIEAAELDPKLPVLKATCPIGTGYICDTTGWHRAGTPKRGFRAVLQIVFASDLLGPRPPSGFPLRWSAPESG